MKTVFREIRAFITIALMTPLMIWLNVAMERDTAGVLFHDSFIAWWIEHPWKTYWPERYAAWRARAR